MGLPVSMSGRFAGGLNEVPAAIEDWETSHPETSWVRRFRSPPGSAKRNNLVDFGHAKEDCSRWVLVEPTLPVCEA